jgi:hypothetical protein
MFPVRDQLKFPMWEQNKGGQNDSRTCHRGSVFDEFRPWQLQAAAMDSA